MLSRLVVASSINTGRSNAIPTRLPLLVNKILSGRENAKSRMFSKIHMMSHSLVPVQTHYPSSLKSMLRDSIMPARIRASSRVDPNGYYRCYRTATLTAMATAATTTARHYRQATPVDRKNKSTFAAVESKPQAPDLCKVPSLPLVGSLLFKSKLPNIFEQYTFWPEMRRRYGDFYSFGLPGYEQNGWCKSVYVINDPNEMMNQVIRKAGKYPSGLLEGSWPLRVWSKNKGLMTFQGEGNAGITGTGESWRRYRNFMQTDLLSPTSARGYVPCIIEAAELASGAVTKWDKSNLNSFINHCSFDMFSSFALGQLTKTACLLSGDNDENEKFVNAAIVGISTMVMLSRKPYENFLYHGFGYYNTNMYRKFANARDDAWEIGMKKIEDFTYRRENGLLTESEKVSYLSRALDRAVQADEKDTENDITVREAQELVFGGLNAAVDTTSAKVGWNLLQVARFPEIQEKLYDELTTAIAKVGKNGRLTEDVFDRKHTPYLNAFIRETHRLTPAAPVSLMKRIGEDNIKIHGVPLPKGTTVIFDSFSLGRDPEYVDDPDEFRPERWLEDAVEGRKRTYREVIDHPFFKEPFGQGPRKCPGSRVAINEVKVLLSQMVLDWKISSPVKELKDVKKELQTMYQCVLPELSFEPRKL